MCVSYVSVYLWRWRCGGGGIFSIVFDVLADMCWSKKQSNATRDVLIRTYRF